MKSYLEIIAVACFGVSILLVPSKVDAWYTCDCCDHKHHESVEWQADCESACLSYGGFKRCH